MKMICYLGIAILLVASVTFVRGQYQRRLLRGELDKVGKVKIIYYGTNYPFGGDNVTILTIDKDKNLISELYEKVASTKLELYAVPECPESQESDPMFEVIFTYKNGGSDTIESTETGKYVFRRLLGSGWFGGPCEDILVVIMNLVARNS